MKIEQLYKKRGKLIIESGIIWGKIMSYEFGKGDYSEGQGALRKKYREQCKRLKCIEILLAKKELTKYIS